MTQGWCVRVSVFDDLVVSISERELAGRDLSEADKDLIRDCAQHLLSFVGPKCRCVHALGHGIYCWCACHKAKP